MKKIIPTQWKVGAATVSKDLDTKRWSCTCPHFRGQTHKIHGKKIENGIEYPRYRPIDNQKAFCGHILQVKELLKKKSARTE